MLAAIQQWAGKHGLGLGFFLKLAAGVVVAGALLLTSMAYVFGGANVAAATLVLLAGPELPMK